MSVHKKIFQEKKIQFGKIESIPHRKAAMTTSPTSEFSKRFQFHSTAQQQRYHIGTHNGRHRRASFYPVHLKLFLSRELVENS